ncbi:Rieske (2Fe-2S) protein [Acuticoccus sediminis]|uniref:Rieske (2Fe-2S) protein n=1 Tax=Acuticoccus sediminis TaxID=2184697 RepID=UPI001B3BD853|nr:Rieske 2Fe-2S domain-containing protein [Acuticoccus sediminis]
MSGVLDGEAWRAYASAPPDGTPVIAASEVETVRSVPVVSPRGEFPLLLVRVGTAVAAYVNACPHQYLPLDYRGPQILSADGARLLCTSHGAQYDAATGEGVAGVGLGCSLDPVPVHTDADGLLRFGRA